jgi:hypothetical protein
LGFGVIPEAAYPAEELAHGMVDRITAVSDPLPQVVKS